MALPPYESVINPIAWASLCLAILFVFFAMSLPAPLFYPKLIIFTMAAYYAILGTRSYFALRELYK